MDLNLTGVENMKIWILVYREEMNISLSAHKTKELAQKELVSICRENWTSSGLDFNAPDDDDEIIPNFFSSDEGNDFGYEIQEVECMF